MIFSIPIESFSFIDDKGDLFKDVELKENDIEQNQCLNMI